MSIETDAKRMIAGLARGRRVDPTATPVTRAPKIGEGETLVTCEICRERWVILLGANELPVCGRCRQDVRHAAVQHYLGRRDRYAISMLKAFNPLGIR